MKKWNIKKILIVISIVIICLGIISGIGVFIEVKNMFPSGEKYIVDGSDFSGLVQVGGNIGSILLGLAIVIYSIFIDVLIWLIYGLVLVVKNIINKIKKNK